MEDLYIYTGSLVIIGASMGGPAIGSLIVGDHSISILLMAIGGGGMLVVAGYELLRTDPEEFTASAIALLMWVGAACLTLFGTILSALNGV